MVLSYFPPSPRSHSCEQLDSLPIDLLSKRWKFSRLAWFQDKCCERPFGERKIAAINTQIAFVGATIRWITSHRCAFKSESMCALLSKHPLQVQKMQSKSSPKMFWILPFTLTLSGRLCGRNVLRYCHKKTPSDSDKDRFSKPCFKFETSSDRTTYRKNVAYLRDVSNLKHARLKKIQSLSSISVLKHLIGFISD